MGFGRETGFSRGVRFIIVSGLRAQSQLPVVDQVQGDAVDQVQEDAVEPTFNVLGTKPTGLALKEDSSSLTIWGTSPLCMASVRVRRCTLGLHDSKNFMSMLASAFAFSKVLLRLFAGDLGR